MFSDVQHNNSAASYELFAEDIKFTNSAPLEYNYNPEACATEVAIWTSSNKVKKDQSNVKTGCCILGQDILCKCPVYQQLSEFGPQLFCKHTKS